MSEVLNLQGVVKRDFEISKNTKLYLLALDKTEAELCFNVVENTTLNIRWLVTGENNNISLKVSLNNNTTAKIEACGKIEKNGRLKYDYEVRHLGENSKSDFVFNGSLSDESAKESRIRIIFEKGSKNSTGNEHEKMIILGDGVKNICRPELLSREPEAVGNHGACCGHLSENELDYLNSRGISAAEAKELMAKTMLSTFVSRIKNKKALELIKGTLDV